jgi:hypothetical protein
MMPLMCSNFLQLVAMKSYIDYENVAVATMYMRSNRVRSDIFSKLSGTYDEVRGAGGYADGNSQSAVD